MSSMFNMSVRIPSASEIDPVSFYSLVDLIKNVKPEKLAEVSEFLKATKPVAKDLSDKVDALSKANNNMMQELRTSSRLKNFKLEDLEDDEMFNRFEHSLGNKNFLRVAFNASSRLKLILDRLIFTAEQLKPKAIIISDNRFDGNVEDNLDRLMSFNVETQMNQPNMDKYVQAVMSLDKMTESVFLTAQLDIYAALEDYYRSLLHRHSVEGVDIQSDAIITDIAISVFENVDSHGEIQDGKDPDEVSAYSIRKAQILGDALQSDTLSDFIKKPDSFMKFVVDQIEITWAAAVKLQEIFKDEIEEVKKYLDVDQERKTTENDLKLLLVQMDDVNPLNVAYKASDKLLSSDERFTMNFRNQSLKGVVSYLREGYGTTELITYILERKKELREYYQDVNSFYVCKTGAGNPFSGEPPGGLVVVPGERPNINMEEILGSGFNEVSGFINQIEASSKFHDLFVASSPSKSADKSNILLVGPQGSGKTEVLRAVGGDKNSIGIFAQGSDFLTCWKGEAEKNPKRLFEAAIKLQKESNKQVHILIDEIDSVLKKKELSSRDDFGLTLEFQILMDGVVRYPNLSVWGATNAPQNIPMPMIRRFNKVLIVGELDEDHRSKLLQQFVGCLPLSSEFSDSVWKDLGNKLKGATGDVIRKVADHIWREKMTHFVQNNNEAAASLVEWLNDGEKFDVASFSSSRRNEFKSKLGKSAVVKPSDVNKSIDIHLKNIAIRNEIDTAVETYNNARKFLEQLGEENV